jgi:hypothetical protein
VGADPAYQRSPRTTAPPRTRGAASQRAVSLERRRREQRFRRRRRDLLEDLGLGLLLAIIALIVAPGLGIVALCSIPIAAAVIGTVVAERRHRRRRPAASSRSRPRRG